MKVRNLLGMPVTITREGEQAGSVCDVVVTPDLAVRGLVVEDRRGRRWFVACGEFTIGKDSVLVPSGEGLKSYDRREDLVYKQRMGEPVWDASGQEFGTLSDLVVEPDTGRATAIEISSGVVRDFLEGRRAEVPLERVQARAAGITLIEPEEGSGIT